MIPMQKKRWSDFSAQERKLIVAIGTAQVACIMASLWDLRRRPAHLVRGSKRFWTPVVLINFVGPLAYFLFGRKRYAYNLSTPGG
jgi:hypothetical protein